MKKSILIALLSIGILSASCTQFPKEQQEPAQLSNLTFGVVKSKIIKGQTTQEEILKIFGSPNIVTKNKNNNEVWNYSKMSYRATSGEDNRTGIFWNGSRAVSTTTTASFDLIVIFDEKDVVIDYSVISAKF
jgi:hypothetical protein